MRSLFFIRGWAATRRRSATFASCLVAAVVQSGVFFATPHLNVVYDGWPRGWLVHLVAVLSAFLAGLWPGLVAEATGVCAIWWSGRYFTPMHPGLEVFAAIGLLQILIIDQLQRAHRALMQRQDELEAARRRADDARAAAEEANSVKDAFLATLSHELRTPLTVILGYCKLARLQEGDHECRQRVMSIIERNALAQLRIVEDLFDVQRLLRGEITLQHAVVRLDAVAAAAVGLLRAAADEKQVTIKAVVQPVAVAGDGPRLQQVVWNLLSNAIKFSADGGSVALRVVRCDDQAVLTVENSGNPIPAAFLAHLFEPFRQADMSTTRAHGGLGLGLTIVKHLVELHGGSVEVNSDERGTIFRVRLSCMEDIAAPV